MILFALFGVPAFCLFAYFLERFLHGRPRVAAGDELPVWHLAWGALYAVPCFFLGRLLARLFPESYRPFLLYLHLLGRDHLFQAGFLALALFTFLRAAGLRQQLFFAAGYMSLLALGRVLAARGMQDAYELFLLPALKMSALLLLPFLFHRARESAGAAAAGGYTLFALVPLLGGLTAYLYAWSRPLWAGLCTLLLFGASLASLTFQRDAR
jgi:hypothetical protein